MCPDVRKLLDVGHAEWMAYGPPDAGIEVVESFGVYEAEYAAIRRGVGMFVMSHRGVVQVTGADRLEFLHRLVTHDTRSLTPGQARRAFMLAKTGRIAADLVMLQQDDRMLIDLDTFEAGGLPATLDRYLFAEDVQVTDVSAAWVHVGLFGPAGGRLLAALAGGEEVTLELLHHVTVVIDGVPCVVYRRDETGSTGLHMLIPAEHAAMVLGRMADQVGGLKPDIDQSRPNETGPKRAIAGRGIGWSAYNTARIEAGTPLYHIDFGADCLPHETGVLDDAVSFTKGCYVGQEVVARMHNLGHPKRMLAGLKMPDARLPVAGAQVFAEDAATDVIGGVTSSAVGPMLGGAAVGFAMMKWGKHRPGRKVTVHAEGQPILAETHKLCFLPE